MALKIPTLGEYYSCKVTSFIVIFANMKCLYQLHIFINQRNTTLKGGEDGSDDFNVAQTDDATEEDTEDVPDYLVNR